MALVCRTMGNSPNSPNFPPAEFSCYTVYMHWSSGVTLYLPLNHFTIFVSKITGFVSYFIAFVQRYP